MGELKRMKRKLVFVILFFLLILSIFYFFFKKDNVYSGENGIKYAAMVDDKNFYIYENNQWVKKFIKGVNMGAAKPGAFPGELAVTEKEYLRWFKYIQKMNADVVRVYTTLKPEFYDALYKYNLMSKKPLYIIQGVWVNEDDIIRLHDAHNKAIKDAFIKDGLNLVDIIHGNFTLPEKKGFASGEYNHDISKYVLAWILGIEWDPDLVAETNKKNPGNNCFYGDYLFTENASPFEAFLCEVGDSVISYETEKYNMQRPVSFANWVTTDVLKHPNEPLEKEDMAEVNTEHIKKRAAFKPGLFASYHIYPYYPDFMNYEKEYAGFVDKDGKINTYKAYLKDLIKEHSMPVLVAEFGVPASRGKAHENIHMGFNQGNLNEKQQGEIDAKMLRDIYDEGFAGALVFTWQDEWFKRTWNTMDFDDPERRPYWANVQTNEQQFGLLAFDPGEKKCECYVDGNIEEWKESKPIAEADGIKLYAKSDEKYIYFMADADNFSIDKDVLVIAVDTIQGQGNITYESYGLKFSRTADFIIEINGKSNSRIKVDSYYDSFYYLYAKQLEMISENKSFEKVGSGIFNNMYLCLNRMMFLPQDKITIPFQQYETGKLKFGNGNPKSDEYDSLTDYIEKNGKIEMRIPWQLLNFMDPSTKTIMGDLYKNKGIKPEKIQGIYIGAAICGNKSNRQNVKMNFYSWENWEQPVYHERLKESYYILKNAFFEIEKQEL